MFNFLGALSPRFILGVLLVVVAVAGLSYVNSLKSDLKDTKDELSTTKTNLVEANNNNKLMHEAYEKTLAIEREIAEQKAITQEQKIDVIKTTSKVKEAVIKRGEIKQDEKSNFSIVTF